MARPERFELPTTWFEDWLPVKSKSLIWKNWSDGRPVISPRIMRSKVLFLCTRKAEYYWHLNVCFVIDAVKARPILTLFVRLSLSYHR